MRGWASWIGLAMIVVAVAPATATEQEALLASCGHLEEVAAAQQALEEGREAEALEHLQEADRLLSRCAREVRPLDEGTPGVTRETANAGRTEILPAPRL